jgi:hypothetical protein
MSAPVPYITAWSTEEQLPVTVLQNRRRTGIVYADEVLSDRDENGVLWPRVPSRPGRGRPQFGVVHPLRQRRAQRRLLCQVCGGPSDHTAEGTLWLLKDHRGDWPGWPNGMGATEPPVCLPCARVAGRHCPALRRGHVAVRVGRSEVAGIYGLRYEPGPHLPTATHDTSVAFDRPAIRWMRASQLIRELHECTIVDLESLRDGRGDPVVHRGAVVRRVDGEGKGVATVG